MCAPRGRRTTRTRTHGGGLRSALRPEHGPRPLLGSRRGAASRRVSKTPRSRRTLSADPAALSRGGRTGTCRLTTREPVTVCRHNLGGRPEAAPRRARCVPRSNRQTRTAGAAGDDAWVVVGRLPAAHRSGRVSGIRPSDRRGPGPVGHRGRNVRSTGRCSYNLRITRRRADSCGLHRSTSQVIRRSGSGVFFVCRRNFCATRARGARSFDGNHLSVDARSGVAARGRSST